MSYSEYLLPMVLLMYHGVFSQPTAQEWGKSTGIDYHCSNDSSCPTWYICHQDSKCKCTDRDHNAVICDTERFRSAVLDCNCVTYDNRTKSTSVGSCYYNCVNDKKLTYAWLPEKPEALINGSVCANYNRMGLLCGDCAEGHSPFVLSYNLSCVKCPDGHKNWWKFILAGFVPLTFFYFFVLFFNINVTSTRLHGVVFYSQALSIPVLSRVTIPFLSLTAPALLMPAKVLLIFYSFWNLDILRSIFPGICLNVTTLQALALDYLLALYPLLLILVSHLLIALHDRKFRCVVMAWKPLHKLLQLFHSSYDVRTSVIDSFATFFLLAHVKVASVTADLLLATRIYQLNSEEYTFGVYYSPTVEYFGAEHLPYAILALVLFTLLVIMPILTLFLYPFQFFQKFLSLIPLHWHFLYVYVDSFQGCYKDGTEPGTFDCRWFSAHTLLLRIVLLVIYGLTLSAMFYVYAIIIIVVFLTAIINIQPYKKVLSVRYPSTDSIFLIFLTLVYTFLLGKTTTTMPFQNTALTVSSFIFGLIPLIYIILLIVSWLITSFKK